MSFWVFWLSETVGVGGHVQYRSCVLLLYSRDNIVPFRYYRFTGASARADTPAY